MLTVCQVLWLREYFRRSHRGDPNKGNHVIVVTEMQKRTEINNFAILIREEKDYQRSWKYFMVPEVCFLLSLLKLVENIQVFKIF